jgi:hypothetical protein
MFCSDCKANSLFFPRATGSSSGGYGGGGGGYGGGHGGGGYGGGGGNRQDFGSGLQQVTDWHNVVKFEKNFYQVGLLGP